MAQLGREGDLGAHVDKETTRLVPILERYVANETIKPAEIELFEGVGWEKLIEAFAYSSSGKASKKIVVRVQED